MSSFCRVNAEQFVSMQVTSSSYTLLLWNKMLHLLPWAHPHSWTHRRSFPFASKALLQQSLTRRSVLAPSILATGSAHSNASKQLRFSQHDTHYQYADDEYICSAVGLYICMHVREEKHSSNIGYSAFALYPGDQHQHFQLDYKISHRPSSIC